MACSKELVQCCSTWLIGDGQSVNFWKDKWLDEPLVSLMNIPDDWQHSLSALVKDFMVNNCWSIPDCLQTHFPGIIDRILKIHIPVRPCKDKIVWDNSVCGALSFREASLFLKPVSNLAPSFKQIWSKAIPPSRSFLVWRIFHHKMPTDNNLKRRGSIIVSMCSLCCQAEESSSHLFMSCKYASAIWHWLSSKLSLPIDHSSMEALFDIIKGLAPN